MDFETIKTMIGQQLKVDPANIMVMIMDLEDQFGITVEDDQIMRMRTVGDVADYIEKVKK